MIGRFFLMHMICIRPEVSDFIIEASCDYSFIPEMCPSGNVSIMTDSDDYLVLEMQPRNHESGFMRVGLLQPRRLGRSLNEWTTAVHRQNAQTTIVYHAGDIPDTLPQITAEADAYLVKTDRAVSPKFLPNRKHPYWAGAWAAYREQKGLRLSWEEWAIVFHLPHPEQIQNPVLSWFLQILPSFIFAKPPRLRVWHPRQADYGAIIDRLEDLRGPNTKLLFLSDEKTVLSVALADGGECVTRLNAAELIKKSLESFNSMQETYDICIIQVGENYLEKMEKLLDRLAPMMKHKGKILVSIFNHRNVRNSKYFSHLIAEHGNKLLRSYAITIDFTFIQAQKLNWMWFSLENWLFRKTLQKRSIVAATVFVLLFPFFVLNNVLLNKLKQKVSVLSKRNCLSSMLVEIEVDAASAKAHRVICSSEEYALIKRFRASRAQLFEQHAGQN